MTCLLTSRGTSSGERCVSCTRDLQLQLRFRSLIARAIERSSTPNFCDLLSTRSSVKRQSSCASDGGSAQSISTSAIREVLAVRFRRSPEQRAIATALSDVDGLLGGLDRLIAKKRDLKQAAMQQLLTGQTRLPGFHGEWEVKRLGEIGYDLDRLTERQRRCDYLGQTTSAFDDVASWMRHGYVRTSAHSRDSVAKHGAIRSAEGDDVCLHGQARSLRNRIVRAIDDELRLAFARRLLRSIRAEMRRCRRSSIIYLLHETRIIGSSARRRHADRASPRSTAASIRKTCSFHFHPSAEQTAIAEVLTDMDAELAALEQRREKTRALKQAMMQELLTGRTRLVSPKEAHA